MPYYGLLDSNGRELVGAGYHRVVCEQARYVLTAAQTAEHDHCFINLEEISFPLAFGYWDVVSIAVYDEADSIEPFVKSRLAHRRLLMYGDMLRAPPGSI